MKIVLKIVFFTASCFFGTLLVVSIGFPSTIWAGVPFMQNDITGCATSADVTAISDTCSVGDTSIPCEQYQGMDMFKFTKDGQSLFFRPLDGLNQAEVRYNNNELDEKQHVVLGELLRGLTRCGYRSDQVLMMSNEQGQKFSAVGAEALFYDQSFAPVCTAQENVKQAQLKKVLNCIHATGNSLPKTTASS